VGKSTQTQPWAPDHMLLLDIKATLGDMESLVPTRFTMNAGVYVFSWDIDIKQRLSVVGYVVHSSVNRYEQPDATELYPGDTYKVTYRLSPR